MTLRWMVAAVAALGAVQAFVPAPGLLAPRAMQQRQQRGAGQLFSTISPAVETT